MYTCNLNLRISETEEKCFEDMVERQFPIKFGLAACSGFQET